MTSIESYALWQRTLANQSDSLDAPREFLRQAFFGFRERVAQLIQEIGALLPLLTVHDITHVDALWRIADEIAGHDFPVNPAEAFVLGGCFLLHDAAHVLAAYENGLDGLKSTVTWKDLIAQRLGGIEPTPGSPQERAALFQTLRHLHSKQARQLPRISWRIPSTGESVHLLEPFPLREYYGDVIGEIAESHHWSVHHVADKFEGRRLSAPAFLVPAKWELDTLKIALLLRAADAAHIDGQRAPWFLFAIHQPDEISRSHWNYQAKMGQPVLAASGELRLTSGSAFEAAERQSWWLAYETARMVDRELRDANRVLREAGRPTLTATSVEHVTSPEAFAMNVRTSGWEPVNVAPMVSDIPGVIATLGGAQLYGDRPEMALRELLQNATDAVRALRALDQIGPEEGEVEVALEVDNRSTWLHVTDTGIGMSRYVLTEVLLDFGNSLWNSDSLRTEIPGLASTSFRATGRFGIGFFSVFMLGRRVMVTTRRFRRADDDQSDQWLLEFGSGLVERPTLRRPDSSLALRKPGTKVSVALDSDALKRLQEQTWEPLFDEDVARFGFRGRRFRHTTDKEVSTKITREDIIDIVGSLCPTLDVKLSVRLPPEGPVCVIAPNDWTTLAPKPLLNRIYSRSWLSSRPTVLVELREVSGEVVGRVGHSGGVGYAAITHGGLRNGSLPKLGGVVLGLNNTDLVRERARPIASLDAWRRWAKEWLAGQRSQAISALIDLHPLCPDEDFAVYQAGQRQFTEVELGEWLKPKKEVRVLGEMPTHEDYDDVSQVLFDQDLEMSSDILVLPRTDGKLESILGVARIKYFARLEGILRRVWGMFEEFEEDDCCVGEAGGVEIMRTVTLYERRDASTC